MREIGCGILAPAAALAATPIANSIAVVAVKDAGKAPVPACAARVALTVDGTETAEELAASLKAGLGELDRCPATPLDWIGSCLRRHSTHLRTLVLDHACDLVLTFMSSSDVVIMTHLALTHSFDLHGIL